MKYVEDRTIAVGILQEAAANNPGRWVDHSYQVARAAEIIANELSQAGYGVDPEIAYNCGLLHDIGRYVGYTPSVIHSLDGYLLMKSKGYEGTASVCVTHSFPTNNLETVNGWKDIAPEIQIQLIEILEQMEWTIYDKIITLCDALADWNGFSTIEKRIVSAAIRNGINEKSPILWRGYYIIKSEIEEIIHKSIYRLLPGIEDSIYSEISIKAFEIPRSNN